MITELRVRDLATISDVTLPLGPGLNVLTGETGAGKSMLVDALSLLLGERADSAQVRPGAARSVVEGVFEQLPAAALAELEQLGLDADEGRVIIRREVSAEGRSRAWVNGSPTTVGVLASLSSVLVDLHGQHETQTLLHAEAQRDILDAYADALPARTALDEAWRRRHELEQSAEALAARRDEVRRRADYLRHVASEIEAARVVPGEDESLALESRRLGQAGALGEHARRIAAALDGGEDSAVAAIARAEKALAQLERVDPGPAAWREALDAAFAGLGDVARDAAAYADALEENPGRLDQVEQRRELLGRLMQKYGDSLTAVLDTGREAAAELELLDTADVDLRALAARRDGAEREVAAAAAALTALRETAAQRLGRGVTRLLPALGLPGGSFSVELRPATPIGRSGAESVEYLVRLNPGHEPRPLARTASGGELSRLMLALKTVLASHDRVPTLVFDEVDQGIGGEVGARVGEALAGVAERRQVLVITHLPQIAARADRHLSVAKRSRGGMATSDVEVLHGEDRVVELARMLGDADAATARRHAQALLSPEPRTARRR